MIRDKNILLYNYPIILYALLTGVFFATVKEGTWTWFSWHPFVMSISFIALASVSVLRKKMGGYENIEWHGSLLLLTIVTGMFGWNVAYSEKEKLHQEHHISLHSQLGIVALLFYVGFLIIGDPNTGLMKDSKLFRKVHRYGGKLGIALGWLTCILGFRQMLQDQRPIIQILLFLPLLMGGYYVLE
jgi:hypothetical protein